MGSIIDRALDIINDHLKDQTSSFSDPVSLKPMARGGHVLEDDYPSHYLPGVGRQVMADGGSPVERAMAVARRMPEEGASIPAAPPAPPPVGRFEGRVRAPNLSETFEKENIPGIVVSPRPGKGSGPRVLPERGISYEQPEYEGYGAHGEIPTSNIEFSPSTPDIAGTALPPPIQHPLQNEPRLKNVSDNTQRILKSPGFRKLVEDHVGLKGPLQITPTHGTQLGEATPSFIINHPDMQYEHAEKLAHLLGFGFQQDSVVHNFHNPDIEDGIPAVLMGNGKKLNQKDIDNITSAAKGHGLDFTVTKDGKAAKFLHSGDQNQLDKFYQSVVDISKSTGLKDLYHARTQGKLINAKDYLNGIFGKAGGEIRDQAGSERSPDLFGRIVDHVLTPYAKATAGEGYRLSPERLAQTFGLSQDEEDKVRKSLLPTSKGDRTTVPLMTGEENLDVRPTGARGQDTVNDVLYALQNRAAEKGQIDPGDFSDEAKKSIAKDIADEVKYHVDNSDKSAVGWYDAALKKAKAMYHEIFPELKTDKDKEMLFDAILGITSQGNDVHSNSVFAARMYDKMRNEGKSIPEAVKDLSGGFGAQTKAIEGNLMKLHHLLEQNGFDRMRDLFNQKKTVSEWNKILRTDPTLKVPAQEKLTMKGAGDQKITGWMVFGPKIGSFINNLHGDYSTLTADLWFSRTWNRLLGHNFIHTPLAEQKQYRDFKDAITAEFMHHNGLPHEQYAGRTTEGQYEKDAAGNVKPWLFGQDMKDMSHDEFKDLVNDPEKMQVLAENLYEQYKGGGFKDKSDARRRAKNWMENRDLAVAAPRGDKEREFQQNTVEEAQKLLKKKYGLDISVADIQAALWFHEKELFSKLGVAPERAQPADYADAAKRTMDLIKNNELYRIKSKEKKTAKAYGGAIYTPELTTDPDDLARRLILWSYAAAPIARPLSRAEGGSTYPVAMPTEIKEDLKDGKAKMRHLSPQEFLDEADPLQIGKGDRHIINSFEHHIERGHKLGPLKLYEGGHQDGRHRANAAKDLGVKKVPVIDYRKADGGPVDDAQNAVDVAKNVSPVENDLLQPIGKSKMVGNEKPLFDEGKYKAGMASYGWNNKRSIRYLHHDDDGNPIGALQIMTQGPRTKKAVIQNVYVSENNRRNKIASGLLKRARQDYDVRHSDDLTSEGRAFAKAVKANGGPVDDAQNAVDVARNLTPMGFYSAAAEAASKFPQKAPIDQIISKIKGQPNVKTAELDNANLKDAFAGQRSVDPQEVARHLQANVPNIKERVYGGKPAVEYKPKELLERPEGFEDADDVYEIGPYGKPPHLISVKTNYESVMPHKYSVYGPSGFHSTYFTLADAVAHANNSINNIEQPLYKEYTIPGGENYREVVMALPQHGGTKAQFRVTGALPDVFDSREEAETYIQQLRQKAERNPNIATKLDRFPMNIVEENKPVSEPYKSSHWLGIPNPLAHLRMSDRDNGKTLHLEELQSDWGQEGRKHGFYDPNRDKTDSTLTQMSRDVSSAVPSGPYVTDTNQWVDLGLKRALLEAAKGGYDKLIWTPGEEQASRYDLSKQIDRLVYNPNAEILMAYKDGKQIINQSAAKNELEGMVGKDVAKNLLASEGQTLPDAGSTKYHILEGQDLAVGGEGMKSFYDKLVPQRLSKLVSQYDKDAKVAPHSHSLKGENGEVKAHSLEITPKLRAAILKGLPAFRSGGDVGKSPIIDRAFKVLSKLSR